MKSFLILDKLINHINTSIKKALEELLKTNHEISLLLSLDIYFKVLYYLTNRLQNIVVIMIILQYDKIKIAIIML